MKQLQLSDEIYDQLVQLATEVKNQDNRATASPYFFQIQTKEEIPTCEGCGEEVWVDEDGNKLRTDEEIKEYIINWIFENEINTTLSEDEAKLIATQIFNTINSTYFGTEDWLEKHEWRKVNFTTINKYENCFLTAKSCDEHISANNHHYNDPRSYLHHAFRNTEMELIFKFLGEIAK